MKKDKNTSLDFEVDKLSNSIENVLTGEVFDTQVVRLNSKDAKQIKKGEWQFDWIKELKNAGRGVYKLTTINNPAIIQGFLCFEDKQDHLFMHLIESAKFNKGKSKVYLGVPGNLVAYACKASYERGYEGYLLLTQRQHLSNIMNKVWARHTSED